MMQFALAVLLLLAVFVLVGAKFAHANPSTLARNVRLTLAVVALTIAVVFVVRGALPLAVPLIIFALGLLGLGLSLIHI